MKFKTNQQKDILHLNSPAAKTILRSVIILLYFFSSCNNNRAKPPKQEIVNTPEQMREKIPDVIRKIIGQITDNAGKMDAISVLQTDVLKYLYDKTDNEAKWSREAKWTPAGDSLIRFIKNSMLYGLFPDDYHQESISLINEKFTNDTEARKDVVLWSRVDVSGSS